MAFKLNILLASLSLAGTLQASQIFFGTNGEVTNSVNQFRTALGGGNTPAAGGLFGGVRREINWDGVPNSVADPNTMPGNFFSGRGVVFSTNGTGFTNSANAGQPTPALFESFDGSGQGNGTYNFTAFSQQRIFSILGSNTMTVDFFLPGTNTASFTRGFGAIFSCADTVSFCSGGLSAKDAQGAVIESTNFQTISSSGLVFAAILATGDERIARIDITSGTGILGTQHGPQNQVVVMDDFIFGEVGVSGVPEPSTYALFGTGLLLVGWWRRRR
jgi:hypothetical protein